MFFYRLAQFHEAPLVALEKNWAKTFIGQDLDIFQEAQHRVTE